MNAYFLASLDSLTETAGPQGDPKESIPRMVMRPKLSKIWIRPGDDEDEDEDEDDDDDETNSYKRDIISC